LHRFTDKQLEMRLLPPEMVFWNNRMSVLNLFLRMGLLLLVCLAGDGLGQTITIGTPTNDSRGVWHVPVTSSFQGNKTNDWKVILPNTPTNVELQYFYLLPVGGESTATSFARAGQGQYGDNVEEALRIHLADRYNAIVICPTFAQIPWYADHPTDPAIQQESYFLQAFPAVEARYPQPGSGGGSGSGNSHRVLAGFSKSGWGACSLGVRHPELFDGIVPWDSPLTDTKIGGWLYYTLASNDSVFGTTNNYLYYQINSNISNNVAALRLGPNRFGLLNMVNISPDHTTAGTIYIRNELNFFSISNTYWLRPDYLHRWYSGWVDDAARFLNQNFAAIPPAIDWTGSGSNNFWNLSANWRPSTNLNWGSVTNAVSGGMISFDNTDTVGTRGLITSEVASNLNISSLLFANSTSSPAIRAHTLQIDPGISLVVTGSYNGNTLEVGQVNSYALTDVAITGGGLLWLDNTNADFKVRSEVGLNPVSTPIGGELDMSGLAQFKANVRDVLVGSPSGYNTRGDVTLAKSNAITASRILVGAVLESTSYHNTFTGSSLNLGPTNLFNANTVNVGYERSGWGILQFAPGLNNPVFTLRGSAGGSSQSAVNIAYGNPTVQLGPGTSDQGAADFSAGSVDFLLSSLLIASTVSDNVTGSMVFGAGSVNANTITIAQVRSGSATGMTASGALTNNGAAITAGTVTLSDSGVSGSTADGTLTLNGGAFLFGVLQQGSTKGSGSATVNLNGGTFAGTNGTSRTVSLPVNLGGNITLGQVAGGTGPLTFNGPVTLASDATLAVNVPVTLSTAIGETGGTQGLTKAGPGTLTIGAAAAYTGPTTVSNGTLTVNGSLNGQVFVEGGVLKGAGTINNNLTVDGGVHAPGASPGIMQVKGNYTLAANATLQIEMNGTVPGTQYDQINLNGGSGIVTLAGSLQIITNANLTVGSSFVIITNSGTAPVIGTFAGLPQNHAFLSSGLWWRINYSGGSGNGVVLTVLPANYAPPTASNDSYNMVENSSLTTAAPGVLTNDTGGNGPLSAVLASGTANGALTLNSDGSFNYIPGNYFAGIDSFTYQAADSLSTSGAAMATIMVTPLGNVFYDNFSRATNNLNPLFPWVVKDGLWAITGGVLDGQSNPGVNGGYGRIYVANANWTNYLVQAQIQFSTASGFGGGVGGRLDPTTGAHYAAWIYPEGSEGASGGAPVLKLMKFDTWLTYTNLLTVSLPANVSTNLHTVALTFQNTNISVSLDGTRVINTNDPIPFTHGGISVDMATVGTPYTLGVDSVAVILITGQTWSAPVILSVGWTNQVTTVMWTSIAGATYGLQCATNLIGADWINVSTNITATGPITGQTNAAGNTPQQFYRVLLQQGP
jgi:autotransporter-associated beta strand protein